MMSYYDDPLAAFGSAEEGTDPLEPYIDPTLFETLDKQAQLDILAPTFDAITIAGVDYDLVAQDSATGKRYVLLKDEEVIDIFEMNTDLADNVKNAIDKDQADE